MVFCELPPFELISTQSSLGIHEGLVPGHLLTRPNSIDAQVHYIKSYHIYSLHCFNNLYSTTKERQLKTDFSIRLCCAVHWTVRSSVCFAKVSGCSDLLVHLCILMCILMSILIPEIFPWCSKKCVHWLWILPLRLLIIKLVKHIPLHSNICGWHFLRTEWN